jgi:hypothetical protein
VEMQEKGDRGTDRSLYFSIRGDRGLMRVGASKIQFIEMELASWNSERLSYNGCAWRLRKSALAPLGSRNLTSARIHPLGLYGGTMAFASGVGSRWVPSFWAPPNPSLGFSGTHFVLDFNVDRRHSSLLAPAVRSASPFCAIPKLFAKSSALCLCRR